MVSKEKLLGMTDVVVLGADADYNTIRDLASAAASYGFYMVIAPQCYASFLVNNLEQTSTKVGGPITSILGMEITDNKVFAAQKLLAAGCNEVEMMLNISYLRSGMDEEAIKDIRAVRDIVPSVLKVIVEAPILTNEELKRACEIVKLSGADFVKTATGMNGATTVEHIRKIRECVGNTIQIKAAGGIQSLRAAEEMIASGVHRFGFGFRKFVTMLDAM